MKSKKTTKNFADVIRQKLAANPDLAREVEEERLHSDIAAQILRLRTEASMAQKDLADHAGTQQSVISRIEDAEYYGHSLKLLQKIADVFGKRLYVDFRDQPVFAHTEVCEFSVSWPPVTKWDAIITDGLTTHSAEPGTVIASTQGFLGYAGKI